MVNLLYAHINNAIKITSDESSSSAYVENLELAYIFYGMNWAIPASNEPSGNFG